MFSLFPAIHLITNALHWVPLATVCVEAPELHSRRTRSFEFLPNPLKMQFRGPKSGIRELGTVSRCLCTNRLECTLVRKISGNALKKQIGGVKFGGFMEKIEST